MPNHVMNRVHLIGEQSRIDEILEAIRYDDGEIGSIDFNKLIPMPESLKMTSGSIEDDAINVYLSAMNPMNFRLAHKEKMPPRAMEELIARLLYAHSILSVDIKLTQEEAEAIVKRYSTEEEEMTLDKFLDIGKQYISNLMQYGATSWYDWCCREWGTKWNSFSTEPMEDNTLLFHSAWSRVFPVITKLAEMYPDIDIEYKWADEDFGCNVGRASFSGGKVTSDEWPDSCSKEAYELAAEVWGGTTEEFGLQYNEETQNYEYVDQDMPEVPAEG